MTTTARSDGSHPWIRRMIRTVAIAATVAVVLGACSSSSDDASRSNGADRPATTGRDFDGDVISLDWQRCDIGRDTECATLDVPRDWDDPVGGTIELALARIPARGTPIGSLLLNPGGPGGSGLDLLARDPVTDPVGVRYDLVSWDPRGVGRSTGLSCGDAVPRFLSQDPEPDDDGETVALESSAAAVAKECASSDGALLAHMRTEDTARDMEAIRAALGEEKLNYIGYSYGTHIGQMYASLFPERVDRMVLDGVVDPDESFTEFLLSQTKAFDEALEAQAVECSAAGKVSCGVDDLLDAYDRVHEAVERRRIEGANGSVGPAELSMAAITSVYQPRGWHVLGPALREALKGNGTMIRRISDSYQEMSDYTPYAAVVCTDGPTPRGVEEYRRFAEEATRVSPRFGAAIANEMLPCATWPVETAASTVVEVSDIPPIILIGNTGDPATPLANAEAVHGRVAGSVLVTVESDGHTAYGSNNCVNRIVESYLIDSELPDRAEVRC